VDQILEARPTDIGIYNVGVHHREMMVGETPNIVGASQVELAYRRPLAVAATSVPE